MAQAPDSFRTSEVSFKIPFHDVDPLGVVWHGHYAKYFELARCALLEDIGYDYVQMKESGYAWPVVDLQVRFIKPARFGQQVAVRAALIEWENRLKFKYVMRDKADGSRLATGGTTQVAVDMKAGETCFASPPVLFEKLGLPAPTG